ncbi:MAG: acetolactate synthase large subunit [Actinobacteria bacterium]|nr:acetolactate synthase large subunit [Actinomycetota bacterium]MCL5447541.1 acetolactate synthase large subunit [Actinomycetota bacterium]
MNGAQKLMSALASEGVEVCFANPGTSELHLVEAIDSLEGMRGVLTLFEGVATGAADGYGRMAGKPAVALLHLGPGLSNGLANLHNARRAGSPVICIVGDQATYHLGFDPPLTMMCKIAELAASVSGKVVILPAPEMVESIARDVVSWTLAAGHAEGDRRFGGRVATMVVPQDTSWGDVQPGGASAGRDLCEDTHRAALDDGVLDNVAQILGAGSRACILLGGRALRERSTRVAVRIASMTGARIFAEVLPARMERGGSIPVVDRLGYLPEIAIDQLSGIDHLVLVDVPEPVSFFAYEGVSSSLVPEGCNVVDLISGVDDVEGVLTRLEGMISGWYELPSELSEPKASNEPKGPAVMSQPGGIGAGGDPARMLLYGTIDTDTQPHEKLDSEKLGTIFAGLLPENAIVVDEGLSEGLFAYLYSAGAPRHDWLCLSGGAIGQGLPLSVGAAIACPDRPVVALEADGSSMYTIQALWTQARESLNIVTIILANRSYRLLQIEMQRLGIDAPGPASTGLTGIAGPPLDFVGLAQSMGVKAVSVDDTSGFAAALRSALASEGPHLIEAVLQ